MNRVDLKELGVSLATPSITVYITLVGEVRPLEKIHHMFGQALKEARQKFPENMNGIAQEIQAYIAQINIEKDCKSVAFFMNKYVARAYALPFELKDAIYIEKMFVTKPILAILNRLPLGWVLVIRSHTPYLFEVYETALVEVVHRHNTWTGERVERLSDMGGEVCEIPVTEWGAKCRYATPQEFMTKIDGYLKHFIHDYSAHDGIPGHAHIEPLIVFADQKDLMTFEKFSCYAEFAQTVAAARDLFSHEELLKRATPLIQKQYAQFKREDLHELKDALKAKLGVEGVEAVWTAARQDRIRLLCVDRSLQQPACEDLATTVAKPGTQCGSLRPIDMVDEIIELARGKGIRVSFYDDHELVVHGGIAAVLTD